MKHRRSTPHTKSKPQKKLEKLEKRDSSLGTPKKKLAPLIAPSPLFTNSDMHATKQPLFRLTGSPKNRKELCPLSSSPMNSSSQRKRSNSIGKSKFIIKERPLSKEYSGSPTANSVRLNNNS